MRQAALALLLVALTACGGDPKTAQLVPLAPTGNAAENGPVNGVMCESSEQFILHVHAHLRVFVDGSERSIPSEIGITHGKCLSWLHTHDTSGIIHVESPVQQSFTLGQFFDVWGQPLNSNGAATSSGAVSAFVNGTPFTADPRTIPLADHNVIQLDIGEPVVGAMPYTWPAGY